MLRPALITGVILIAVSAVAIWIAPSRRRWQAHRSSGGPTWSPLGNPVSEAEDFWGGRWGWAPEGSSPVALELQKGWRFTLLSEGREPIEGVWSVPGHWDEILLRSGDLEVQLHMDQVVTRDGWRGLMPLWRKP